MSRTTLSRPETDRVKALFAGKKLELGYSQRRMAELSGFKYTKYREMYLHKPTTEWKLGDILKFAKALGIPKDDIRAAI